MVELRGSLHGGSRARLWAAAGRSDLEDLTQESLLGFINGSAASAYQSRLTTWATTIAVNCALSELRRRRYQAPAGHDAAVTPAFRRLSRPSQVEREAELAVSLLRQGIAEALTDCQREATLAKLVACP